MPECCSVYLRMGGMVSEAQFKVLVEALEHEEAQVEDSDILPLNCSIEAYLRSCKEPFLSFHDVANGVLEILEPLLQELGLNFELRESGLHETGPRLMRYIPGVWTEGKMIACNIDGYPVVPLSWLLVSRPVPLDDLQHFIAPFPYFVIRE